jgi:hypothetical protein
MAPTPPTPAERHEVLTLVARGQAVDSSVHGETLATLIGEDCLALEGAFQSATLSLTRKGIEEMARSGPGIVVKYARDRWHRLP